jgi:hypothetical protein
VHDQTFNSNGIAFFRAALRYVDELAKLRFHAFKCLRSSFEKIGPEFGWGAKCALLVHFSRAMHNDGRNKLILLASSPLPFRAVPSKAQKKDPTGHYFFCLEGSSKTERMNIQGSFDSLYTLITNELSTEVGPAVQLCLINCLGIRVLEEDHAMISRVSIFQTIHELLTTAISGELAASSQSESDLTAKLTKAAMKLFIVLTLQVASTGEGSSSKRPSLASLPEAPLQTRSKSGPATLSTAVFNILFDQLSGLSVTLQARINQVKASKGKEQREKSSPTSLPHIDVSNDAMVVLSEATALLLHLASHEVCQRLLSRPKWIALLLNLLDTSPMICQKRAELLLFD